MGKTQQTFAVEVLKCAISTVGRYENSLPPKGDVLLELAAIAETEGFLDLRDTFKELYIEDVRARLGFHLMIIPETETRPAHGYLMLKLEGREQLQGAQSFLDVVTAVDAPDPEIRNAAIAGLESLRKVAHKCNANPITDKIQDVLLDAMSPPRKRK